MKTHTPGPWEYVQDGDEPYWSIGMNGNNPISGQVMVYTTAEDARLIAAAPELLAALRQAKSELIDLYEKAYPESEPENSMTAAIDRAIAAIKKAEGSDEE
jgi:hypothetical protein